MATIKLTVADVTAIKRGNDPYVIEGEEYIYHNELDEEMDDDGRTVTYILQRKSDGAFFSTALYWVRWGYEDYNFEADMCELEMTQVALVPVTILRWEAVI